MILLYRNDKINQKRTIAQGSICTQLYNMTYIVSSVSLQGTNDLVSFFYIYLVECATRF